jgi:hypothetical protein
MPPSYPTYVAQVGVLDAARNLQGGWLAGGLASGAAVLTNTVQIASNTQHPHKPDQAAARLFSEKCRSHFVASNRPSPSSLVASPPFRRTPLCHVIKNRDKIGIYPHDKRKQTC